MADYLSILEIIINAMFTGVGVTLGTYLANKGLIKHLESIIVKLDKNKNKGEIK